MDLASLRQELFDRGFDYVSPTRAAYWLNRAYHRACERYPWPFLQTTTTGVAPLDVSDIRAVLSIADTTTGTPLEWRDQRTILEMDPTLSVVDTPSWWYLDGNETIAVYPTNTSDTLSVVYTKVPTDLTDDSDVPLIPTRYQYLLVDGALHYAYLDSDNAEMAQVCLDNYAQAVEEAAQTLMVPNYDNPADVVIRGSVDW